VPELASVAVGDGRVADVVVARRELARGALQEERRGIESLLEDLACRADVVGREQLVLPRQGRWMAGVVEDRRQHGAVVAGDPRDEHRVVRWAAGVVAGGEALRLLVPEIAVGRERAAAGAIRHPRRDQRLLRLDDRRADLLGQVLDVWRDQLAARLVRELRVDVRTRVRVRHVDEERGVVEPGAAQDRGTELLLVRNVLEPAEVHGDEGQRRLLAGDRREDGGGGGEGPVDALRDLVRRRAPGAGIDPDRRRDVARRDSEPAAGVAMRGLHSSLLRFEWFGA
jgi:hypothetical protein